MVVKNEQGQAIFEMLVFLPIFIFLMTIIFNIGDAINVSINQQKAVRRYFYFLAKGNSYLPLQSSVEATNSAGIVMRLGMAFTGYKQVNTGGTNTAPLAPCFKFNSFLTGSSDEECEDSGGGEEELSTNFIRVYTGYGVCGDSFIRVATPFSHLTSAYAEGGGQPDPRSSRGACIISSN